MTTTKIETLIRDAIGTEELAKYLTARHMEVIGVYADGSVSVGEDVGMERVASERPIASTTCSGIGNLDMTWWRNDLEGEEGMTDREVIEECCAHGDISDQMEELIQKLIDDANEDLR